MKILSFKLNQKGIAHFALLIAAFGVIAFVLLANTAIFKNQLFSSLFPKSSSSASGIVDLSIAPATQTVTQNQNFTVNINMDAKTEQVSAAEIHITFDATKLQPVSFTAGTFLPVVLVPGSFGIGTGTITLGSSPSAPVSGAGTLASVTFKALTTTTTATPIAYDATLTQVAAVGKTGSVVGNLASSQITINAPVVNGTAVFSLSASPTTQNAGVEFPVTIRVQTDTDAANLFAARLNFDPTKLQVTRIDITGNTFVPASQWAEQFFDNSLGKVSVVGGVPAPGFKTTGSPATYAVVYFRGVATGATSLSWDSSSVIYRNSDNTNILATPTALALTINPGATPTPSPTANPSTTPTPTPNPTACNFSTASWVNLPSNPVNVGTPVTLQVTGTGPCSGQTVAFNVREDDGLLGTDPVVTNPVSATFNASNVASTTWLAEYQVDGIGGIADPPEYVFIASLISGATITSADPKVSVNKPTGTTVLAGDINRDGKVDLQDLSIMLTNWNRNANLIDELDQNGDGVVNTFDYSLMLVILRNNGTLH